jgi:hypothetical protein
LSFVEEEVADGSHAIVALLLSLEVVSNVDVRVEICSGAIGWGRLPSCRPSPPRTTRRARRLPGVQHARGRARDAACGTLRLGVVGSREREKEKKVGPTVWRGGWRASRNGG